MKTKLPRGPETSLCNPERRYNFFFLNCSVTKRKREKEREEREKKPHVIVTIFKQGFCLFFFFLGIYIPVFIGHILENVIHLVGSEAKIWF